MKDRVLRPGGGQPVCPSGGGQRPADHEAEIARSGRCHESRIHRFRELAKDLRRIGAPLGESLSEAAANRCRVLSGADRALGEAAEELEG